MKYFFWSILFITCFSANCQYDTLQGRFINYDLKDGLVSSSIRSITQDADKFIYCGTADGLCKFDGIRFSIIDSPFHDSGSLGNVIGVEYDSINAEVIVASQHGLFGYSTAFDTLRIIDSLNVLDLEKDDLRKSFYYSGKDGMNVVRVWNPAKGKIDEIVDDYPTTISDVVRSELADSLWYFSFSNIYTFNSNTQKSTELSVLTFYKSETKIYDDLKINGSKLYAANISNGLIQIDLRSLVTKSFLYAEQLTNRVNMVRHIEIINDSILHVSTSDKGIGEINLNTGKYAFYVYDPLDQSSISLISGRSTFIDVDGNLWAAMAESLSLKAKSNNYFNKQEQALRPGFLAREFIANQSISINNDLILQGTNKLLFVYDKQGNPIANPFNYSGELPFNILDFIPYTDDLIYARGPSEIYEINIRNLKITKVYDRSNLKDDLGFSSFDLKGAEIFGDEMILHTSQEIGSVELPGFEMKSRSQTPLKNIQFSIRLKAFMFFISETGLYKRNSNNDFERLDYPSDAFNVDINEVTSMSAYNDHILLGSQSGGAAVFNPTTEEVFILNKKQGTQTNKLHRAVEDAHGNIWATSSAGLYLYNKSHQTIKVFDKRDNLYSNDLIPDHMDVLDNGRVAISVGMSLITWNPNEIDFRNEADSIYVTLVNGQKAFSPTYDSKTKRLKIEYSTFDYGQVRSSDFSYRLNEQDWEPLNVKGSLDMPSLNSGKYKLQLKVVDKFGRIGYSPIYQFKIAIPWQKSWWFYTLIGFCIALLTYLILQRINKEKENTLKVKQAYENLTKELENQVLRSQMNPHFLFNSMNSIRYFILSNETQLAANYLTKFSRLIRKILENSRMSKISLKEELETIKLYVDLEKLRFEDKFDFKVELKTDHPEDQIMIPPMLIQPYLENAIIHGINAKETKSLLELKIQEKENFLLVEICDDGIGIEKAYRLKENTSLNKESLGHIITEQRLKILSSHESYKVEVSEYKPLEENPGTRVIIKIPI